MNSIHRWAAMFPEVGRGPVSTEPCISRNFYEEEKERVFKRAWLMVAREEELASTIACCTDRVSRRRQTSFPMSSISQ